MSQITLKTELLIGQNHFEPGRSIFINRAEETFDLDFHSHDFVEITYVTEGRGFHYLESTVVPVSKGDLFVLPIGVPHVFRPSTPRSGERLIVLNCIFTEQVLQRIHAMVEDFDLTTTLGLDSQALRGGYGIQDRGLLFDGLMQAMFDEYNRQSPGIDAMLMTHLSQLLIQLARRRMRAADPWLVSTDPIAETIDYMRSHVADKLTLSDMANRVKLSERHFYRLFQKKTGQSFQQFVQHMRMLAACELLNTTTNKVAVIAEKVGYKDIQSFHSVFKRIVGVTPGTYRKQLKNSDGLSRTL